MNRRDFIKSASAFLASLPAFRAKDILETYDALPEPSSHTWPTGETFVYDVVKRDLVLGTLHAQRWSNPNFLQCVLVGPHSSCGAEPLTRRFRDFTQPDILAWAANPPAITDEDGHYDCTDTTFHAVQDGEVHAAVFFELGGARRPIVHVSGRDFPFNPLGANVTIAYDGPIIELQ